MRAAAPGYLALIICLMLAAGCHDRTGAPATSGPGGSPSPEQTEPPATSPPPTATVEPTPDRALSRSAVWVGVDGLADAVAAVIPGETVVRVALPLNAGQLASNVAAGRDGNMLVYLVWDADGSQRGIAAWAPENRDARLIVTPDEGYRIIALTLAADAGEVAFTQVAEGEPFERAAWLVSIAPTGGGEARLAASRSAMDDSAPLAPLAWPAADRLILGPTAPGGEDGRVFTVNPQNGEARLLVSLPPDAASLPAVSPDGDRIAYLCIDEAAPQPAGGAAGRANAVCIVDIPTGQTAALPAPEGQAIISLRWHPDGQRLLLDMVRQAPDDPGQVEQFWALAGIDGTPPWPQSAPGAGREALFDYTPYGEGVLYTLIPVSGSWQLYWLPALDAEPAVAGSLDSIALEYGAPVILYTPPAADTGG